MPHQALSFRIIAGYPRKTFHLQRTHCVAVLARVFSYDFGAKVPSFSDLGVPADLVASLSARGIHTPFDVQASTIVDTLNGADVAVRAPTGSGKTLAFGIPVVARSVPAKPKSPTVLILSPTRELSQQIVQELSPLAQAWGRTIHAFYGGASMQTQRQALRRGVDIAVACPGRLADLERQHAIRLDRVQIVVIDEADRMADMGFLPEVRALLDLTNADRQTLLFSATLDGDIAVLQRDYQRDPIRHEVGPAEPDMTSMQHLAWRVDKSAKTELVGSLSERFATTVVFCRARHIVDKVTQRLERQGVPAVALHGGRSQSQRDRALSSFKKGRSAVLVATDVAARGIHVDGVDCVVHHDLPEDHKAYIHRSGRTARAGASGTVITLIEPNQTKKARRLLRSADITFDITDAAVDSVGSDDVVRTVVDDAPTTDRGGRQGRDHGKGGRQGAKRHGRDRDGRDRDGRGRDGRNHQPRGRGNARGTRDHRSRDTREGWRDDRSDRRDDRPNWNDERSGRRDNRPHRNDERSGQGDRSNWDAEQESHRDHRSDSRRDRQDHRNARPDHRGNRGERSGRWERDERNGQGHRGQRDGRGSFAQSRDDGREEGGRSERAWDRPRRSDRGRPTGSTQRPDGDRRGDKRTGTARDSFEDSRPNARSQDRPGSRGPGGQRRNAGRNNWPKSDMNGQGAPRGRRNDARSGTDRFQRDRFDREDFDRDGSDRDRSDGGTSSSRSRNSTTNSSGGGDNRAGGANRPSGTKKPKRANRNKKGSARAKANAGAPRPKKKANKKPRS